MKPIQTEYTNAVFTLEGGTEENNLPVEMTKHEDGQKVIISTWELTKPERRAISSGRNIELLVYGEGHPPVALRLQEEEDEDGGQ